MGYSAHEANEGERPALSGVETAPRHAAEQWQSISTLNQTDAGKQAAQNAVDHYFGTPMITGADGVSYLQGHVSNVPEISQGVQNCDDLKALGNGMATGLQSFGNQALNYMETKNAVRDSLLQLGPVLDTAVNYYANTRADQVGKDAQTALSAASDAVEQNFSFPLKPEQRGEVAGSLMPLFVLDGLKEPLHPQTIEQMGLGSMSEEQLAKLGIKRFAPEEGEMTMPEVPVHLRHLPLRRIDDDLIKSIEGKERTVTVAEPGSEHWTGLEINEANAKVIYPNCNEIIVRQGAPRMALLEEFLHGTQNRLGILDDAIQGRIPRQLPEIHVKDFMLRHAKLLGLDENDQIILRALKQEAIKDMEQAGEYRWTGK